MLFESMFAFSMGMMFFILFLGIGLLVFWVWAIIDCLSSDRRTVEKLVWVLVILAFNVIGALLYLIFKDKEVVHMKDIKGKKLFRSHKNRMVAGVCAGIGEYFGIDPTVVRLLWVLFTLVSFGTGVIAYIVAWIIIPEK